MQVLNADDSWIPEKISISEMVSSHVDMGLEAGLVSRSRVSATSTNRYLLQLKPDHEPQGPDRGKGKERADQNCL
ncbi:hypothetical protein HLB44_15880 [Aquincola sp. S2]|uniref:Uncharacterized protein n=1 Tax=Pseudaquabacterium terrae TaxID=2732868 RepID=A0ABX2EIN1_9BURK|nr:hypothetical protein [Aquabacterium terrae]NRF68474.1 hypothetical protein [Aquabacterium terrae]